MRQNFHVTIYKTNVRIQFPRIQGRGIGGTGSLTIGQGLLIKQYALPRIRQMHSHSIIQHQGGSSEGTALVIGNKK